MESLEERQLRRAQFASLVATARSLSDEVKAAVLRPIEQMPGWRLIRVPIDLAGIELRIAESIEANVPYSLPAEDARSVVVSVRRGRLRILYEGIEPGIEIGPDHPPLVLPSGIARTTFVSEHPCTVVCVILGGSGVDGSAVDLR